ncbi:winged helix-turn-helix domain-containing protein [Sphingobium sp. CECT 9361]|uniref:winged helix-turn-helix domain-containing protein n=1 Tax=Sphingobium sp. CECT 9361 TaxID=2845384 RepID=UPI001E61731A|nr:winged helix-turn-helix domain-containing protein [Sphingobium sp. CECT 9361]
MLPYFIWCFPVNTMEKDIYIMFESNGSEDVLTPILSFLSSRSEASAREIKVGVCKKLNLFAGDRMSLSGRENEPKIYNTIQNALRPNQKDFIERVRRDAYRITPKGREWLMTHEVAVDEMTRWLNDNYPGAFD